MAILWEFSGKILLETISFALIWQTFVTKKEGNFAFFFFFGK